MEEIKETLEEAALRLCLNIDRSIFIQGAKWQQEQDKNKYSEEEVLKLVDGAFHMYASSKRHDAKEWLVEQFKKK